MKTTDKQIAANITNALKSTGPNTPEGKAIAARNSLKHGLLAKEIVINTGEDTESPEQFYSLLADLKERFDPQGPLEEILVEKIATSYWRLRRALRFEVGLIRKKQDAATDDFYNKTDEISSYRISRSNHKNETDEELNEQIEQAKAEIKRLPKFKKYLIKMHKEGKSFDEIDDWGDNWQWLVYKYDHLISDEYKFKKQHPENSKDIFINSTGWSHDELWKSHIDLCDDMVSYHKKQITELEKEKQKISLALQVKKMLGSIPEGKELERLLKYEGSIERQFYKAIDQLERLQRLRRGDTVPPPVSIDLNVNPPQGG